MSRGRCHARLSADREQPPALSLTFSLSGGHRWSDQRLQDALRPGVSERLDGVLQQVRREEHLRWNGFGLDARECPLSDIPNSEVTWPQRAPGPEPLIHGERNRPRT